MWIGVAKEDINLNEWLGKQPGGWVFGSQGSLCHNTGINNGPYTHSYGKSFDEDCIRVTLDMDARTLSYGIGNEEYGVAFSNLPEKVYPAISLTTNGKVSILNYCSLG
jgi:hypothetical protein